MKHTTLTPPTLKIAIVSAILGLGAVSTANAQAKETFFPNMFNSKFNDNSNKLALDSLYHNMILGKTAITPDEQYKFYADDGNEVPDSLFFNKLLHEQQLNGFKAGYKIIPLDENGKPVYTLETKVENGATKQVYTVTTKIATEEDVANSPYAHGIQKDIDDLYSFDQKVTDYLEEINIYNERQTGAIDALNKASSANTDNIAKNQADIANNIDNIYELAQQQDQHSSDIKTLAKASAANKADADASFETLTKNQNTLIEKDEEHDRLIAANKADADANFETLTKNQNTLIEQDEAINQELEGFAAHADVQDKQILQNQADIANNQADIANNINNIYELAQQQDQHASDIKTLAKASAANKADADAKFKGVQTDIANNKITLANHAKKINDNQQAIEAKLGGKVDAQKLVDLETKVNQNQGEVDKKLATVQENYSQLNTQVQSVDNKIGMVDTRVNALDDKVENSMAAQAALNGLFQPYNVGKVSVSVAVGAYGSKSAIAVGAGYRVNPHLAFKGGAAINTSGSRKGSYNLGINYEF